GTKPSVEASGVKGKITPNSTTSTVGGSVHSRKIEVARPRGAGPEENRYARYPPARRRPRAVAHINHDGRPHCRRLPSLSRARPRWEAANRAITPRGGFRSNMRLRRLPKPQAEPSGRRQPRRR